MGNHTDLRITESDVLFIKQKARRMVGHLGYRISDVEDLEQELAMHVSMQMHRHRPELGSREKFVSKISDNKLLNIIAKRTAKKRNRRHDVSLDAVNEAQLTKAAKTQEQTDLALDVRQVILGMPEDLQRFAVLLMEHNKQELARLLNLTRAQVRHRLTRIEKYFHEALLDQKK